METDIFIGSRGMHLKVTIRESDTTPSGWTYDLYEDTGESWYSLVEAGNVVAPDWQNAPDPGTDAPTPDVAAMVGVGMAMEYILSPPMAAAGQGPAEMLPMDRSTEPY